MELKNERNSFEKKIQVSSGFVSVSSTTYSACWHLFCYAVIDAEALTRKEAKQVLW